MSNDANWNPQPGQPARNPFADNFSPAPVENANPYAAPAAKLDPLAGSTDELIRLAHINHEASLRGFGFLFILGGSFMLLGSTAIAAYGLAGSQIASASEAGVMLFMFFLYGTFGVASLASGIGLRRLNGVGKIGGTLLGSIGLLGIPVGTIINAYLLYLIWSEKGRRIFSPDYQRIRMATPHVKPRTPLIAWIILVGFLLLILSLFFLAS